MNLFGGAVGYEFDNNFSLEAEYSFQRNDIDSIDASVGGPVVNFPVSGNFTQNILFLNAIYDFDEFLSGSLTPYVLAGGGLSFLSIDAAITGLTPPTSDDSVEFTFQLGAGVEYNLTDKLELDLSYKFRGISVDGTENLPVSHLGTIGLKYKF